MGSERSEITQPIQPNDSGRPLRRALWVTLVYLGVGLAWITFSDQVVERWFPDPRQLSLVQTWKGFLFVAVTGVVLFLVMWRQLNNDRNSLSFQEDQRRALRRRERQLSVLMNNLPGMAYRCLPDEDWTMLFVSAGCSDLTGYRPDELVHNRITSYAALIDEGDTGTVAREVASATKQGRPFSVEYALTRRDGSKIWVWERGCGVRDDDGSCVLEGIILDISDRKKLECELEAMATRDSLTGVLNRRECSRVLDEELARASRYQRPLALLWIDFDHFKEINDTWGHAAGDLALCSISRLLEESVRSVDALGRFGGEEFVIILPEMDVREAGETAERLRQRVSDHAVVLESGQTIHLTISTGVAVFPDHGETLDALCAAADKAMYWAKKRGRNCVVMAQPGSRVHNGSG
ncbi:sensor domain-containing diguanylate cyclase [Marinobacter daepoensis]|uniref:diguanylate cyclase n=1 Tax=Marinobacter daepoensis TaxID=262077 RepID=A0ABS3BG69_9GAMM|nr:sensor domain-containing diguanylate cyclase [Marinobacter daepoensis]MBN7769866.1 sensor domain-containing diguanylate cyclase [Marinobacter daepoensis]MBY6080254.1 sensor domain-containing diguanylate cyclase [Marinobacter daepoensis]